MAANVGIPRAQTLSARKATQGLETIHNGPSPKNGATAAAPRSWAQRLGIDSRAEVKLPRAVVQGSVSSSISSRLQSVLPTNTSWLHHGFGAPVSTREAPAVPTVAPAKSELHPLGLLQRSSSADAPKNMSTLDRQAHALIQGEKDLSTFFGEVDSDDAISMNSARSGYLAKNAMVERSMASSDYGSSDDSTSLSSVSVSDSSDESDHAEADGLPALKLRANFFQQQIEKRSAAFNEAFDKVFRSTDVTAKPVVTDEAAEAGNTINDLASKAPDTGEIEQKAPMTLAEELKAAKGRPIPRTVEVKLNPKPVVEGEVSYQDTMTRALSTFQSIHGDSLNGSDDDSGRSSLSLQDVSEEEWDA